MAVGRGTTDDDGETVAARVAGAVECVSGRSLFSIGGRNTIQHEPANR